MRKTILVGAAGVGLGVSAVAYAGGFETGENGTRALGRGGAYVATVDEPSAIYFNPAALARIGGTAATLNLNLVDYNLSFQREPFVYDEPNVLRNPTRTIEFEEVEQELGIFPAPMLFVSTNFGLEGWGFGFGAYGPSAYGKSEFPDMTVRPDDFAGDVCGVYRPCRDDAQTEADESVIVRDGGQGYMMTRQTVLTVYPSLAVARYIERANLSLGLTLQAAYLSVDFETGVDGSSFDVVDAEAESVEADDFFTPNTLSVTDWTPTAIVGVLWEPTEEITVGASYRPRFNFLGKGSVEIDFPSGLLAAEPRLTDNTGTLKLRFPDAVRLGAAYTKRRSNGADLWDVGLDVVYEGWSRTKFFEVNINGGVTDNTGLLDNRPIPTLRLGRYYQDSVSVRAGSDLSFLRDAETGNGPVFRLGASYETSSSPEEWTNVDFTPFARLGTTAGFSYHVGPVSIDLAYAAYMSPERTVTDGKFDVMMPLWICNAPSDTRDFPAEECAATGLEPTHAVNNGTYNTFTQTFSVGATYGW